MQQKYSSAAPSPALIIAFGVSGSGKSTVAQTLSKRFGLHYLDADDFHSDEARARMAGGEPLTDTLRAPWIAAICAHLKDLSARGENAVLAFSGLKKQYREPLRDTGFKTTYLFLAGDKATILERMTRREDHFMPPALLDSQFATLELPSDESDVVHVDVCLPLDQVVEQAVAKVEERHPHLRYNV